VGDYTLVGASGEYSDFQYIMDLLHELMCVWRAHEWDAASVARGRSTTWALSCGRPAPPFPATLWPRRLVARVRSLEEHVLDDNAKLSAPEIHSYLTRVLYGRRNKMNPLWNTLLVAGVKDGARCGSRSPTFRQGRQRQQPAGCESAVVVFDPRRLSRGPFDSASGPHVSSQSSPLSRTFSQLLGLRGPLRHLVLRELRRLGLRQLPRAAAHP
jgi:hypothetical protein